MPTAAPDSRCEEDNAGHRASPAPQPEREIGRAPEVFPGSEVPSTTGEGVREKRKRSRSKSGQSAADSGVVCDEPARTRDSQSSEESATSDYSSGSSSCAEQSDAMLLSAQHRTDRAPLLLRQGALQQALLLKRARRCARQEHRRTLELQYALLSDADGDRSVCGLLSANPNAHRCIATASTCTNARLLHGPCLAHSDLCIHCSRR